MSRLDRLKANGAPVELPPCPAPHLVDWWLDIGPTGPAGEGQIAWQEIAAWEGRSGIELDAWEARTIRRLSRAWLAVKNDARDPYCPAPWSNETPATIAERTTRQFEAMVNMIKSRERADG